MKKIEELLRAKIAGLESQTDMLESEIGQLDAILRTCGFPNGIETLKKTVLELLKENENPFTEV